jgi:hypothetical protein
VLSFPLDGYAELVPVALRSGELGQGTFPVPELGFFVQKAFLSPESGLYNVEHEHLLSANVGYIFTDIPAVKNGKALMGQAEMPNRLSGSHWAKARAEQQLAEWFGGIPDFLITLFSPYVLTTSIVGQLALLDHELYHCGHLHDGQGIPKFKQDGSPVFTIKGHDVEEFVGVARRWGVGAGAARELANALLNEPELAAVNVSAICATCVR